MKTTLILIVFGLLSITLLSQEKEEKKEIVLGKKKGDVLKGKHIEYIITMDIDMYNIENTDCVDSILMSDKYGQKLGPWNLRTQIKEIVRDHLKLEEIPQSPQNPHDDLYISFTLNKDYRINKIRFAMSADDNFWTNFPIERFEDIEKDIFKLVTFNTDEDKDLLKTFYFDKGEYFVTVIERYKLNNIEKERKSLLDIKQ